MLSLGDLPAKGYASHGESWSFALGLKLAAYRLLRRDLGDDPVLVLDDVFAELDSGRRERLAALVADCVQVLITAAVGADVPEVPRSRSTTVMVELGQIVPAIAVLSDVPAVPDVPALSDARAVPSVSVPSVSEPADADE